MQTVKTFVKWLVAQQPANLVAVVLIIIAVAVWLHELALLPLPVREGAVGWWDYWLNRYQTLISGLLAIVAGAFALVAAHKSIAYDRAKTEEKQELTRRDSINAVQKVVSYTSRSIFSKHLVISLSRFFPMDCVPTAFMDVDALEKILFDNLKSLPPNMAMKCLYLTYAMKLQNGAMQNLAMAHDQPENPTFKQNFKTKLYHLREIEGLMFACEIVDLQLRSLASMPATMENAAQFDLINDEIIKMIRARREVPESEILPVLRDLGISVIKIARVIYE